MIDRCAPRLCAAPPYYLPEVLVTSRILFTRICAYRLCVVEAILLANFTVTYTIHTTPRDDCSNSFHAVNVNITPFGMLSASLYQNLRLGVLYAHTHTSLAG